ncbi:MAG: DUF3833 domain-containing protein [Burkholderiaceae bacterium]
MHPPSHLSTSLSPSPLAGLRRLICLTLTGLAISLGLSGCASPKLEDYAKEKPVLDLEQYFAGRTTGWGIVQDRFGRITRRFVVEIDGRFEGDRGELDERFVWSDGEKQRRVWRLRKVGPQQWVGEADDVVGQAQGRLSGNALQWGYTLAVPIDGRTIEMQFDDWMVLVDEEVLMNRAVFSKFGIRHGEVTLSFRRQSAP